MKKANIVRMVYGVMYFFTSFVNLYLGVTQPEILRSLSQYAFLPFLGTILNSVPLIILRLSLIGFAAYQLILSALLFSRGKWVKLGLAGSIIFHIGIIPFGVFNLPNILIAIPPILILKGEYKEKIPGVIFSRPNISK